MDPMIGMIFMVPWNWAPMNYQLCQGQLLNVQQYEALYSLMGFVFGGNGSSNFNLPNLQGRAPIGTGILNTSQYTLGNVGGTQTTTLSQTQLPAHIHGATFVGTGGGAGTTATATGAVSLPFSVTVPDLPVTGSVTVNAMTTTTVGGVATPTTTANVVGRASGTAPQYYPTASGNVAPPTSVSLTATGTTVSGNASGNVTLPVSGGGGGITGGSVSIAPAGSSLPFSNMQPYLAMTFIIAVNGLYPDRP